MQVLMRGSTSIPANGSVNNVIEGEIYDRSPWDADGAFFANGSATGLSASLFVGTMQIGNGLDLSDQNRVPIVPDDMVIQDWEAPDGDKITIPVTNSTGGILVAFWTVILQAV